MKVFNHVIVKLEEFKIRTKGGLELYPDLEARKEDAAPISGTVVHPAVLNRLDSMMRYGILNEKGEQPYYKYNEFYNPYHVGDRVWFQYNPNKELETILLPEFGPGYSLIPFDSIIAYQRGKGFVLCAPHRVLMYPYEVTKELSKEIEAKITVKPTNVGVVWGCGRANGERRYDISAADILLFNDQHCDKKLMIGHQYAWSVGLDEAICVIGKEGVDKWWEETKAFHPFD